VVFERVTYGWEEGGPPVFQDLDLVLPNGVVSLVGQNGTGKSTLLLLAGGVMLPTAGRVLIHGVDSRELRDETARHRHVSFIYQNMEFETDEPIGAVLAFVHRSGFLAEKDPGLVGELVTVFELERCLGRKLQQLSKGELQRAILAFSLLYGSPIVIMDEPVFALEETQRYRALEFLTRYAARANVSIYYSAHELDLSERYSRHILLFHKDAPPVLGPTDTMFVRERIEEAYQVPMTMLKARERLYRKLLIDLVTRERPGP
jgi:ABC-type cobalamin/Fe3+-siderophores transport system ATPase subunit